MTVQEFTNNLWYGTDIVIIDKAQMYAMSGEYRLKKIKEKANFVGTPHELRSCIYDKLKKEKNVNNFGIIENNLIIEVD